MPAIDFNPVQIQLHHSTTYFFSLLLKVVVYKKTKILEASDFLKFIKKLLRSERSIHIESIFILYFKIKNESLNLDQ